jgi:anhydro-N-acetylmuramic acid kinase
MMRVIGIMSGTSADGIDVALCELDGAPPHLSARIVHAHTVPYTPAQREQILRACDPATSTVRDLCLLNATLAEWFAEATLSLLRAHEVAPASVDLIASHGQTVWHEVAEDGRTLATLQLGTGAILAERTGITVINDFRTRDVSAGGRGAPLTSYVDWLLLRHPTHWRAVQNIGGMGNVSLLPPLTDDAHALLAFDTGAGNALIDAVVYALTDGAQSYDRDGHMAQSGQVQLEWLSELMAHPFLAQCPPKTTGRETFGTAYALALLDVARARGYAPQDIVATLTAFTAESIADAYRRFAPHAPQEVIVGGGGARNPALMRLLAERVGVPVLRHEDVGLDGDSKEALVFAVLGYETWHNRPATLPSQTGARHASVLGQITPAQNYADLLKRTLR